MLQIKQKQKIPTFHQQQNPAHQPTRQQLKESKQLRQNPGNLASKQQRKQTKIRQKHHQKHPKKNPADKNTRERSMEGGAKRNSRAKTVTSEAWIWIRGLLLLHSSIVGSSLDLWQALFLFSFFWINFLCSQVNQI